MSMPTIANIPFNNKTVILRADLNVPLNDGKLLDDTRISSLFPTIDLLCKAGARIILISHFGRPQGKKVPNLSLKQILPFLEDSWKKPIQFAPDCIGPEAKNIVDTLQRGEIALLENLRFHPQEEDNEPQFARSLAELADIYVNDGFAVSHRAHASVHAITEYLPSYAGLLMEKEIHALTQALQQPKRPLAAIVAGSKISTKLELLKNLLGKVDFLLLSGGIANTFLKARHFEIGTSLYEPLMLKTAQDIEEMAQEKGVQIILPIDATGSLENNTQTIDLKKLPEDFKILDIGPKTVALFNNKLEEAQTLVWNGPLGVFEIPPYDQGTTEVAKKVAELSRNKKLFSIAGGGETLAALTNAKCGQDFSYLSTAGGAFLEWLEGKKLPGVCALIKS